MESLLQTVESQPDEAPAKSAQPVPEPSGRLQGVRGFANFSVIFKILLGSFRSLYGSFFFFFGVFSGVLEMLLVPFGLLDIGLSKVFLLLRQSLASIS